LRQKNAFNPIIIMSFYYCEMLSHSYEICLQRLTELRFSSNQMNSISATCLFMTKTYWRTAKSFWHKGSMWIGWLPEIQIAKAKSHQTQRSTHLRQVTLKNRVNWSRLYPRGTSNDAPKQIIVCYRLTIDCCFKISA
jgi:hypothetical protein